MRLKRRDARFEGADLGEQIGIGLRRKCRSAGRLVHGRARRLDRRGDLRGVALIGEAEKPIGGYAKRVSYLG